MPAATCADARSPRGSDPRPAGSARRIARCPGSTSCPLLLIDILLADGHSRTNQDKAACGCAPLRRTAAGQDRSFCSPPPATARTLAARGLPCGVGLCLSSSSLFVLLFCSWFGWSLC